MAEVVSSVALQMIHDLSLRIQVHSEFMGVGDEVMSLLFVLTRIHRLLKHSHTDSLVARNEETIRDLAYKIEDVLETCFVEVAVLVQKNESGFRKSFLSKFFPARNYVPLLKNIKARIAKLEPEIDEFWRVIPIGDIDEIRDEPLVSRRGQLRVRQTHPRGGGNRKHFVGMDDELTKLVDLVVEQETRVVSILGVTGLGKTTIARKIYNHPKVRDSFKAFAWVCLDQGCEISILLQKILRQLGPRKGNETGQGETVVDQLQAVQRQKNCLIVLDNIQDIDHWRQLSHAFATEGNRSRDFAHNPRRKCGLCGISS